MSKHVSPNLTGKNGGKAKEVAHDSRDAERMTKNDFFDSSFLVGASDRSIDAQLASKIHQWFSTHK